MANLLSEAAALGMMPSYTGKLLAVVEAEVQKCEISIFSACTCPAPDRATQPTRV